MEQTPDMSKTEVIDDATHIADDPPKMSLKPKTNVWMIIAIVCLLLLISVGVALAYVFVIKPKQSAIQPVATTAPSTLPETKVSWKTYTNTLLNYSIDYPSDWTPREFSDPSTGAAFRPSDTPNDFQHEYITINKYGKVMHEGLPNPTFEQYVRRAGSEIQNYGSVVNFNKVVTSSGMTGYMATFMVTPMMGQGGKASESLPRTYFEIPGNSNATIQVTLDDERYLQIYNQMLLSFKFINKPPQVSQNPNLKTYTSSTLGLSFTYLVKQNSQTISVFEKGTKICVTYDANDANCEKGQSVEVFQKGESETIQAAITRLFLAGKDLNRCLVTLSDPKNLPSNFVKAEITFPGEFNMETTPQDTEYCAPNYAQTNGVRYFLEDKLHPTKLLFFSIGQYGISSENNQGWQDTISLQ